MIGRYRNHRGDRGGRVRDRERYTPNKSHIKKTVEGYLFYVGSRKQAQDYEIMAEFVANHTKNTFDCGNDVAEEMQTLVKVDTYVWNATIKISSGLDETIKEREKTKSS